MSSAEHAVPRLVVRDGGSQDQRTLAPLQDGYFKLAGMSFAQLLALASECARLVKFHRLDDSVDGDWAPFFAADETVLLARILSTRLERSERVFQRWYERAPDRPQSDSRLWALRRLPMTPLAVRCLDRWLRGLAGGDGQVARTLQPLLASVIARLCDDQNGFAAFLPAPGLGLSGAWRPAARGDVTRHGIRANYYAFVKAIEMVQREARRLLPASLASERHDPGTALLVAFIRMVERLGLRLDRFTARHIDFYYERVLGAAPLPALPDHTHLVVAPSAPGGTVALPAGTEFLAKPDPSGPELAYRADAGLLVTDARVQALHTLYFHEDPCISPEAEVNRGLEARDAWPTHAWAQALPVPAKQPPTDRAALRPWPLLGAPKSMGARREAGDARIGFALASTVLLLAQGRRHVRVALGFTDATLAQRFALLDEVERADDEAGRQDLFLKVFRHMFTLELSGPDGWIPVADYDPSVPDSRYGAAGGTRQAAQHLDHALVIEFDLPLEAPAVVPCDPAVHGEDYGVAVPVLRFLLNPDSYVYPYGLLRGLELAQATIEVEVSGYRQVSLHNQLGPLSAAIPFQPFGPIPAVGSYLVVGAGEAAAKHLTAFEVELEWGGLPVDAGGFRAYYHDYPSTVDTGDYVVRVETLADGVWQPPEERAPVLQLFQTDYGRTASRRVLKRIRLSCAGVLDRMRPDAPAGGMPADYSAAARNGFFKFTLAGPRFAFGHREYAHALGYSLKRGLRDKTGRFHASVPEAPYTPVVDAVTVRYKAKARIDLHQAEGEREPDNLLLHLHPLGWEAVGAARACAPTLLPHYAERGHLHIGVQASALDELLTLFFHLQDDSLPGEPEPVRWSYLSNNRWKPLRERDLVADGTANFMKSGVVAIDVPRDITRDNSVMPAGLFWLRIGASRLLRSFCSAYGVYAQALRVTRDAAAMHPEAPVILPADSIRRTRGVIAGLGKVTQVVDSLGGKARETRAEMHTRVAARLRHKGRAVTPADYQDLVLERFPEVYKVKCFPNLGTGGAGPGDWIRPGRVLVVPLPHRAADGGGHMPLPNGRLLREIRRMLEQEAASPAARIAVVAPVYEQIQVRCSVSLKEGLGGGRYVERLNEDISRYLSPWEGGGARAHFGWSVRRDDVAAYIQGLDYVDELGDCALVRIAPESSDLYRLSATERHDGNVILPSVPWSVGVPIERHQVAVDKRPLKLKRTGLETLGIGSTFIISEKDPDDKAES